MNWYVVRIHCAEGAQDALTALLHDRGSTGTVEGEGGEIAAYFPGTMSREELEAGIQTCLEAVARGGLPLGQVKVSIEILPDRDWNETWKASFTPIEIDEDTVILPPWLADGYEGNKKRLIIDPGMAFGTGHHPTTRECIRAVSRCARSLPGRGGMLDVGTGTGVLAVHGAILGFSPVVALDIDPAAIDAAQRNAKRNGVGDRIRIRQGGIETVLSGPYALITANLLLNILVEYVPRFKTLLGPGGLMVLSGILASQENTLTTALRGNALSVRERRLSEEWVTLIVSG